MNQIPSEFILAFLGMVFAAVFLLSQSLVIPVFGEAGRVRKRIRGRLQVLERASDLPNMQTVLRQQFFLFEVDRSNPAIFIIECL